MLRVMSWQTKLQILLGRCVNGLTMEWRLHVDNLYKQWIFSETVR